MSGSIIPTPDYRAVDGQSFGTQVEKQRLGFIGLSLTNYDNNSAPQIAAGSCIEISGSIFKFPSNDSITGTPSSGNINYIMLTVSGSGDSQIVTASWMITAPTWNTSKQGWYDATNAKRYVGGCYYDGTNYIAKGVFFTHNDLSTRYFAPSLVGYPSGSTIVPGGNGVVFDGNGTMILSVNLPDGAVVTDLYSYCDVLPNGTIEASLRRSILTSSVVDEMALNTHSGIGALTDSTISNAIIDNSQYTYFIQIKRISHTGTTRLSGMWIKYVITRSLP